MCSIIIIQHHIQHPLLDNYIAILWYPYTLYLVPSMALAQKAKAKLGSYLNFAGVVPVIFLKAA